MGQVLLVHSSVSLLAACGHQRVFTGCGVLYIRAEFGHCHDVLHICDLLLNTTHTLNKASTLMQ